MRTRNGRKPNRDERNRLIDEFLRFVRVLRPKAVMMENVPKLKSYHRFQTFCRRLRSFGYSLKYDVLEAADYGVPQRRKRLILLASQIGPIEFAQKSERRATVRQAIGHLESPGRSGDPLHDLAQRTSAKVLALIKNIPKDGGSRNDLAASAQLACHKRCNGFKDVYGRMA